MNSNNVKVSVIIPTFNRYKYLLNAFQSIENQDYGKLEVIIINDGSTDESYSSSELKKLNFVNWLDLDVDRKKNYENGPANIASLRNIGISHAKGEYVAFLDDDDLWLPGKLQKQISIMEEKRIPFSSTDGYFGHGEYSNNNKYKLYNKQKFFNDIKKKYKKTEFKFKNELPSIFSLEFLKVHNCVITSSVVVSLDLLKKVNGFNNVTWAEDYDCWLRLLEHTDLQYIDEPLFYYDGNHAEGRLY
jgi:glycosyltransferase involved in cell wall biosynthesis